MPPDESWPEANGTISLTLKRPDKDSKDERASETPSAASPEGPKIYGVFSVEVSTDVGTGTTKRKSVKRVLRFVEEIEPDAEDTRLFQVQPLNTNNIPTGKKTVIPLEELVRDYTPEVEYYQTNVFPKMKELDSTLSRAEKKREEGAYYSAQFDYEKALEFDEENVRANFGLGLTYMARGETEKAADVFNRIVTLDAAFSPDHKHLFNEFGINLRKSKLHDQAVEYYSRALEMTTDDENLYYNIARAYYERGDRDECRENLEKALQLNPDFDSAQQFLDFLKKKGPTPHVSLD